jgi:hypothetical protein
LFDEVLRQRQERVGKIGDETLLREEMARMAKQQTVQIENEQPQAENDPAPPQEPHPSLDPVGLLYRSIAAVPQMKWALAVVGLIAAVAIVQALVRSPIFGLAGAAGILVAMVLLFIFSRVVQMAARASRLAATVFMWFTVIIGMATIGFVFWSLFFNEPWPLRDKMFATEVTRRVEAAGFEDLAESTRGLSEAALAKLVQLGDSYNMVGSIDRRTGAYTITPIPPEVRELDSRGLIEWSQPPQQFDRLLQRLDIPQPPNQKTPTVVSLPPDLDAADREALLEFSYHLNDRGRRIYDIVVKTILRQIKEV